MADGNENTKAQAEKNGKTVLIAMDGSKHAIYAFKWYAENVYLETDTVIIAHCAVHALKMPTSTLMAGAGDAKLIQHIMKEHEDEVMKVFKIIDELANKYHINHKLERLHGNPGEAIVKAAKQQNVDLIIVGSRGQGAVRRTIIGSVSDYVIHHTHVPVLICKDDDEKHKLK